jgi:uncharacterized protein DUF2844
MMSKVFAIDIALILFFLPLSAQAALGGGAASVQADQIQLNGSLRTATTGDYTLYEIQLPSGSMVREFVSLSDVVFAVAWEGPSLPDLRQFLGSHFEQYVEAARTQGGGPGPRVIQQPGLVVNVGGHMRAFSGKAYIPQMLPQGLSPEQIQ